jgi:hypothetical protein
MSRSWNRGGEQANNRRQNNEESALHDFLLEQKYCRISFTTRWDALGVTYHTRWRDSMSAPY